METGRNVFRMGNPDGSGKARVERGRPFVRRNAVGIRSVCMKNLAQSMNAGVCPAGTVDTAGGASLTSCISFSAVPATPDTSITPAARSRTLAACASKAFNGITPDKSGATCNIPKSCIRIAIFNGFQAKERMERTASIPNRHRPALAACQNRAVPTQSPL